MRLELHRHCSIVYERYGRERTGDIVFDDEILLRLALG
jgi:hypothetical protein